MKKNQRSVRSFIADGIKAGKKVNSILVHPLPTFRECQKCLADSGIIFANMLDGYALLPSEDRVEAMKNDLHEMMLRNSLFLHDQIGILEKLIAFENEKIEKEKKRIEIERLIIEAEQKAIEASGKNLDKDAPKLVLIGTEKKIAGLFRDLFLPKTNKRGELIFRDSQKVLAQWICNSIILENGEIPLYSSVYNYLSRPENPDNDVVNSPKMS
jgi:hypothetical protein